MSHSVVLCDLAGDEVYGSSPDGPVPSIGADVWWERSGQSREFRVRAITYRYTPMSSVAFVHVEEVVRPTPESRP